MKEQYKDITIRTKTRQRIEQVNEILEEYSRQGFSMTIRQLYYQMVSRGVIAFDNREYEKLVSLITKGRDAGLIDWNHITDRARAVYGSETYDSPKAALKEAARLYREDLWRDMPARPLIAYEKAGLAQIIERATDDYNVDHFSTRGECSITWLHKLSKGYYTHIFYLGDHDGHGVQISDGLKERLALYSYGDIVFERIGISLEQGEAIHAPKIELKKGTNRTLGFDYVKRFGVSYGYEIDAFSPTQLSEIIRKAIESVIDLDPATWQKAIQKQEDGKKAILKAVCDG